MLEPRGTDIPVLLLVFVVLPLVIYVFLGKWNEAAKKKERISLLAEQAAQEAFPSEPMAPAIVMPVVSLPTSYGIHECARCYSPATTRCSQCKTVRYCSGKCQIIHWRQVHKHECQLLGNNFSSFPLKPTIVDEFHGSVSFSNTTDSQSLHCNVKPKDASVNDVTYFPTNSREFSASCTTVNPPGDSMMGKRSTEKLEIGSRVNSRLEDEATFVNLDPACKSGVACSSSSPTPSLRKGHARHKLRESGSKPSSRSVILSGGCYNGHSGSANTEQDNHALRMDTQHPLDAMYCHDISNTVKSSKHGMSACDSHKELFDSENLNRNCNARSGAPDSSCSPERILTKRLHKDKAASNTQISKRPKSPKQTVKTSREHSQSVWDRDGQTADESKVVRVKDHDTVQGSSGITSKGIMRMIGLKKLPKLEKHDHSAITDIQTKVKMLFPYEDFIRFFQYEALDMSPRGLVNCGNSCYANAVLQCLTCTKPLTIYLLRRSHSSSCCMRDWCLMCELEQHVMKLRESGGALSPSRILSQLRRTNCQIGDGSQEDAHEFLRLLVASMQSICLEGLGGEHMVDLRLQETTFIQHTFGGRLQSKVKCLRCYHESERSENIMDLTLEIFGWVESLEDALTQYTSPEDLDGENMYRCGRCVAYVRAQKKLSIQEAPNVLTIVLKRFQEGNYGKINKCITFPEMLDMTPFMTGTDDSPPLYMLYAVVVHLDTLNASFSGHYISYVKDLQGRWFRIDDSEVQPVSVGQVMSEGAYILFYMRSSPRLARTCSRRGTRHRELRRPSRAEKSSRLECRRPNHPAVRLDPTSEHISETDVNFCSLPSSGVLRSADRNRHQSRETYGESLGMEFTDATSSDWSLFTSSDEASFTTESTRDSFSTVDYADGNIIDPIASIFNPLYAPEYSTRKTVACSMFSGSKPHTRFFVENKAFVSDSNLPASSVGKLRRKDLVEQLGDSCTKDFLTESNCNIHVTYGNIHQDEPQTY